MPSTALSEPTRFVFPLPGAGGVTPCLAKPLPYPPSICAPKQKRRVATRKRLTVDHDERLSVCRRPVRPHATHFSGSPTPSEHLMFLHGFSEQEPLVYRHIGIRRLKKGDIEPLDFGHNYSSFKASLPTLLNSVDRLVGEPDAFVTQSSFVWGKKGDPDRHRTSRNYLNSTSVVFVDIDVYNSPRFDELGGDTDRITNAILVHCDQSSVPRPVLIHSGQGFYAYWALSERYSLSDKSFSISRWQALQNRMMSMLAQFSPDTKVKDTTRVLRLVGTVNGKNNTPVTVQYDDGAFHSFDELERQFSGFPVLVEPVKEKTTKTKPSTKRSRATSASLLVGAAPTIGLRPQLDTTAQKRMSEAVERLVALRDVESAMTSGLPAFRRRYWNAFSDIVRLIQLRGGLYSGERDELIFWLLVTRYQAGFLTIGEIPAFSESLSHLCDVPLDVWEAGMLSSLHQRIIKQNEKSGTYMPHRRAIRHIGMFRKVPIRRACVLGSNDPQSAFKNSIVYTPSYKTLIEKLAITEDEQTHLSVLLGVDEKKRRAYANSSTAKRIERNEKAVSVFQKKGVAAVVRKFKVSRATAYRMTQAVRPPTQNKALVYRLREQGMTLRDIATEVGVSLSTVSRWVKQYIARKERNQFESQIVKIALGSTSVLSPSLPLNPLFYQPFTDVSLSHSSPLTIEAEEKEWREAPLLNISLTLSPSLPTPSLLVPTPDAYGLAPPSPLPFPTYHSYDPSCGSTLGEEKPKRYSFYKEEDWRDWIQTEGLCHDEFDGFGFETYQVYGVNENENNKEDALIMCIDSSYDYNASGARYESSGYKGEGGYKITPHGGAKPSSIGVFASDSGSDDVDAFFESMSAANPDNDDNPFADLDAYSPAQPNWDKSLEQATKREEVAAEPSIEAAPADDAPEQMEALAEIEQVYQDWLAMTPRALHDFFLGKMKDQEGVTQKEIDSFSQLLALPDNTPTVLRAMRIKLMGSDHGKVLADLYFDFVDYRLQQANVLLNH